LIRTVLRKGIRFVGAVREEERPELATTKSVPKQSRSTLPRPDRPSIAVLPFSNMSGDPEQDYFADGISEDIITGLSKLRWFFVIARNSSFTTKAKRSIRAGSAANSVCAMSSRGVSARAAAVCASPLS
jgi:hypothetical protein